jgi:hypothetical protein
MLDGHSSNRRTTATSCRHELDVGAGSTASGTINTSLGFRVQGLGGISGEFEYGTSGAAGKVQSQTVSRGAEGGLLAAVSRAPIVAFISLKLCVN